MEKGLKDGSGLETGMERVNRFKEVYNNLNRFKPSFPSSFLSLKSKVLSLLSRICRSEKKVGRRPDIAPTRWLAMAAAVSELILHFF
jgi:hypothetical protein